jgi:four helix bundle protein
VDGKPGVKETGGLTIILPMSNTTNTTNRLIIEKPRYDVHERIYNFIVRVINLVNSLPKTSSNTVISQQLLRSATSIGANDQEADGTITKKDFIHCYTVVRKEIKETNFWLKLIGDTNPALKPKMESIIQEGQELAAITSSIINKTRVKT